MKLIKNLFWIIPVSLVLGAVLSLLDGGTWWIGFLSYSLFLILGLSVLSLFRHSASSPRSLVVMLILALFLRLSVGIFFSWALPLHGNDTPVHNAGYIFRDAYTYDNQSWELAASGDPLWSVFNRLYGIEEQYGGLTVTLSFIYRYLSPDFHRQWLTILFSAVLGAAGVGMAWKAARLVWGERVGWLVGWIMALYPESLLAGASQIREPFLILFIGVAFWGMADWFTNKHKAGWIWAGGAFLLSLLFSPPVGVFALVVLVLWFWFTRKDRIIHWWWVAGAAILGFLGIVLFGILVSGTLQAPSGPLANLVDWLRYSAFYSAYQTEASSGWIQSVFRIIPEWSHIPFITAYGVVQPLLPAAIADPAAWPSRVQGIFRGIGWYALLPFLIYSIYPILKTKERPERIAWLWIWVTAWIWILMCSFRAGGDQWDNPRYRLMMLFFQALLAAFSISWARGKKDPWLGRILLVEGIFLTGFLVWYISRYDSAPMLIPFGWMVTISTVMSALIIILGLFIDRRSTRKFR